MNPPISPDLLPFAKGNTAICYDPALIALCTSQLSSNLSIHWWRSFPSSVAHFFCPYLFYSHSSSEYCLFYYNIWRHMPPWSIPIILNLLIMEQPKHSQLSGYYLNTLWLITHLYWPSLCSEDTVCFFLPNQLSILKSHFLPWHSLCFIHTSFYVFQALYVPSRFTVWFYFSCFLYLYRSFLFFKLSTILFFSSLNFFSFILLNIFFIVFKLFYRILHVLTFQM